MGDRGAGESRPPSRSPWLLPSNGRRGRARRRRGGCRRVGATGGLARRAALSDAVGRVAGGGALDQRASEDSGHPAALVRGCASPSVASGNLAGHLIALAHACEEMMDRPRLDWSALAGIEDTAQLVRLSTVVTAGDARPGPATRGRLEEAIDAVTATLREPPPDAAEWAGRLAVLKARAQTVRDIARARVD